MRIPAVNAEQPVRRSSDKAITAVRKFLKTVIEGSRVRFQFRGKLFIEIFCPNFHNGAAAGCVFIQGLKEFYKIFFYSYRINALRIEWLGTQEGEKPTNGKHPHQQ